MKKPLLILLSLILIFALTSCAVDKDKVQIYEDFVKSYTVSERIPDIIGAITTELKEEEATVDLNKSKPTKEQVFSAYSIYSKAVGDVTNNITITEDSIEAEGIIKGKVKLDDDELTEMKADVKDVKISFKYTLVGSEETKSYTISLNTVLSYTVKDDVESKEYSSLKMNGVTYKDISCTRDENNSFTKATVGGENVDLRLLNNQLPKD